MSSKRKSLAELKEEYEKALARAEKLKQQMKKATAAEEAIAKNNQVLTEQKEEYTKTKKKLKDTSDKIDLLTASNIRKVILQVLGCP